MLHSKALAQGSLRDKDSAASIEPAHLLTVLSKDTPIQIWDVAHQGKQSASPVWHARNVSNDELDL